MPLEAIGYSISNCQNGTHSSIPYIGNRSQKKKFANFANLEAFTNVFLHFLSQLGNLVNYGKEGNLHKFSFTDNSRYTVFNLNTKRLTQTVYFVMQGHGSCSPSDGMSCFYVKIHLMQEVMCF